ncbi:MAG: hypothetical protein ACRDOL_15615 [Streptosporangiaceae bacterium]
MADGFVSVSRRIEAPAERLFALLADSANHPLIDGSGMVREPAPSVRLSRTGDAFVMDMHHEEFGDYQMRNEVVESCRLLVAWALPADPGGGRPADGDRRLPGHRRPRPGRDPAHLSRPSGSCTVGPDA